MPPCTCVPTRGVGPNIDRHSIVCAENPRIIRCKLRSECFCLFYDEKRSVIEFPPPLKKKQEHTHNFRIHLFAGCDGLEAKQMPIVSGLEEQKKNTASYKLCPVSLSLKTTFTSLTGPLTCPIPPLE